ncbi:MAG: MBL fold metallo-hydrolase [Candidatus Thorarchaeota archaeon]
MVAELRSIDRLEAITIVDNIIDYSDTVGVPSVLAPHAWTGQTGRDYQYLWAGWGLSVLVSTHVGEESFTVLYDTGPSPEILAHNVKALGLDLSTVDAIVMSHGHWDHFGGLIEALEEISKKDVPVYLHPRMFFPRRVVTKTETGERVRDFTPIPTVDDIKRAGGRPVLSDSPVSLAGTTLLRSGEIPRMTPYETGMPGHQAFINGRWVDDSEILDDSCLIAHVRGRGLIVITGCAHSGVINSLRESIRLTGVKRVYAVMGGTHLTGYREMGPVNSTIEDLKAIGPEIILASHCTGLRAQKAIARQLPKAQVSGGVGLMLRVESTE